MKKITYILVAILILTISFEPLSNIYYEKNEKYLADSLSYNKFFKNFSCMIFSMNKAKAILPKMSDSQ